MTFVKFIWDVMRMNPECKYWLACGAAPMRDYHAKQFFGYDDVRRNYIDIVCCVEKEVLKCEHYKIREGYKKELTERKEGESMEETYQKEQREMRGARIIVPAPFVFDSLTKILRRTDLIVKNAWLNDEPSQKDVNLVIQSIEEAIEWLSRK